MGKSIATGVIALLFVFMFLGMFNMLSSILLKLEQFFFHNSLGIISLICTGIAILFAIIAVKLPRAIRQAKARSKPVTPVLRKLEYEHSANLSTNHTMNEEIQERVIDMESMNLESFFRDIAITLNKPAPIIFKGWGNRRLELDVERVQILRDYIGNVRRTADEYLKLRADMFFSKEKFEHYVEANRVRADGDLDLIKEEYKERKWNSKYDKKMKKADLKDRKIAQKEKLAQIEEQKARNKFFVMAINEFPEMPSPLKAYMFSQVYGKNPDAKRDFDIEEKITEYMMKKYDNDIENMNLETKKKKEEVKTQIEKMKHEREKKYE